MTIPNERRRNDPIDRSVESIGAEPASQREYSGLSDVLQRELARANRRLRTIVDSTGDSICAVGPDYCLLLFNEAYARGFKSRFGYAPSVGMNVLSVFDDQPRERELAAKWWARALSGEAFELIREVPADDRRSRFYDVRFTPIRDEEGRQTGAVSVTREITKLIRAERALEDANEQLRQANRKLEHRNRELQDFASIASHDLREPLRKIHAFADLITDTQRERVDADGRLFLDRIQTAAMRMTKLLDDVQMFSGVQGEGMSVKRVDLNRIARQVISSMQERIDETQATVNVEPLPTVAGNREQIYELVRHLVDNAIKFRRPDAVPRVHIRGEKIATSSVSAVRIEVEDNGIGFDEKYLDRIFSPFERLHDSRTYGGTGMGLAVCRRIAERHGGGIEAKSEPGRGSTFSVLFPDAQQTGGGGV